MKSQGLKKYKIPDKPGVYFFLKGNQNPSRPPLVKGGEFRNPPDKGGRGVQVLYIGKATSLRDRTKSYFSKDLIETRGPLILEMVFKADGLKWQETDSVLEALILEANLIKKHQPYYNTKEKDDKSFNYVCITRPARNAQRGGDARVAIVRGKVLEAKKYNAVFGPFPSGSQLKEALKIVRRIFPYFEEKKGAKGKDEFYKQIQLLPETALENKKNIKNIKLFFEGKKTRIVSSLKKEMMAVAKRREFEKASEIKRQIFALQHINDVALIKEDGFGDKKNRIEAYDIAHMSGQNMVGVMTVVVNGEVEKSEYKKFIIRTQKDANDVGALEEVLSRRLRHTEWGLPDLIVVDGSTAQKNMAERVLKRYQFSIPVVAVVKNEKHKPERLLGEKSITRRLEAPILLGNAESHRFAIRFHKQKRSKNFLV